MQIEEPLLHSDILRHAPLTHFTAGRREEGERTRHLQDFSLCEE